MTAPSWISINRSSSIQPTPSPSITAVWLDSKKGEYDLAIKAFNEAIKLNPDYGEAFANRAQVYLKKSEHDRAARDYSEAIRIHPNLEAVLQRTLLDASRSRRVGGGAGGLQQGNSVGGPTTPRRMTPVG